MAKKKEKTLEEKLQEALVPENQWPYMLPENWCWTRLKYIANTVTGGTPSKKHDEYYGGDFPFYKPADLDSGRDLYSASEYLSDLGKNYAKFIPKGSVAVCCIGSIGKTGYFNIDGCTNQQINSIIPKINSLFVFYYASCDYFTNELWTKSSATTISIVNKSKMDNCYIPLPPLSEQKRIVHRIESLFAKLDEAKEKIQQVLDGAEMRKAAILHKAFTGELTKTWRKENTAIFGNSSLGIDEELISDNLKKLPDNWCWCKIGDFLELKAGKNIKAENISIEKNDNNKYACYGGNGIRGYVDSFNVEGTHIIIGRQGALCGNINIAENKFYATEHAVVVYPRYDTDISWLSENLRFLNLNQYSRSAAQPGLAVKNINNVLMPVAPYAEQVEMGRLISQMLNVWKQKEIICNKVLNKIDIMKKSILAKAFRGELGTNNPTEDSALNLLKEVLQDKF
mgnify:CR=1 FL=1